VKRDSHSRSASDRRDASARRRDEGNPDQRLGFLMHDVSRLRRAVFDEFMKPAGVTRSQWWVLAHLSRRDGMIQSDLAEVLELGKAALGKLVDRLEASRFIARRPDPADRRVKRIHLTPDGMRMVLTMREQSDAMSERILTGLTVRQRRDLAAMLDRVKRNLMSIRSSRPSQPQTAATSRSSEERPSWTST